MKRVKECCNFSKKLGGFSCLKRFIILFFVVIVSVGKTEAYDLVLANNDNHLNVDSTKCKASFIYFSNCDSVVSDCAKTSLKYYFFDQSKGNIIRREWRFGDGQISSEKYAIHTYGSIGTYTVTLTVYCVNYEDSCFSQIKIVNQEDTKNGMSWSPNVRKNKYILPCVVLFLIATTILIAFISNKKKL